jgi:hypothetical protein
LGPVCIWVSSESCESAVGGTSKPQTSVTCDTTRILRKDDDDGCCNNREAMIVRDVRTDRNPNAPTSAPPRTRPMAMLKFRTEVGSVDIRCCHQETIYWP